MESDEPHWGEKTKSFFLAMPALMIADISLTTFLLISPSRPFVSSPRYAAFSDASAVHLRACVSVPYVLPTRRTPPEMFVVRVPGEFKLLSFRHGSTAEVGFIQVCVQNDASSTAHYDALILGGLYRGRAGRKRKIEDGEDRNKEKVQEQRQRSGREEVEKELGD